MSGAVLVVRQPGLASSLQDLGRRSYQRYGISESGALDAPSLRLANALVGNAPGAGAIEITLTGPTLVVEAEGARFALVGAPFPAELNGATLKPGRSFTARRGDVLTIGAASSGARAYLAVAGGFAVEPVLGSVSTHSRSRLGGLKGTYLQAGDRLPLAHGDATEGPHRMVPAGQAPAAEGDIVLRVLLGPQDEMFTPEGVATFLSAAYAVSAKADRMGYQLEGERIGHADGFNIVSDGIVNGSIQVPGNGQPIVLLADRQTTGGYPKIATVIEPDLPLLAQLRTGERLRFRAVGAQEAEAETLAFRERCAGIPASLLEAPSARRTPSVRDILSADLSAGIYRDGPAGRDG